MYTSMHLWMRTQVAEDNPKLQYLLNLNPIPDHRKYAAQLLAGIERLLDKVSPLPTSVRMYAYT